MIVKLIMLGKNKDSCIDSGITDYLKRLTSFNEVEVKILKGAKMGENLTAALKTEASQILNEIAKTDYLILLDERGKEYSSTGLAAKIEKWREMNLKCLVFLLGGAYGFADEIYNRSNEIIALSKMTLTHQHARLIFSEQLYRAFTIIHKHPYHHT
ncbi:MAG: 23S rRNA (pseudouridine(1915)-N(3))-methyltransferase RlmH [Bacteroidetes bacterium]|jgi:23S rRNA (pseudouridine1915-N3)-methyltransferase|nr:23S rRNA (pseudouridine(1915)-N(3))-methyltransferase RlmH [Bacteroidota bacterium]